MYNKSDVQLSHLDGEAEDLNAHAAHIRWGHLSHQSGKFVSVLVNLLNSQSAWQDETAVKYLPLQIQTATSTVILFQFSL